MTRWRAMRAAQQNKIKYITLAVQFNSLLISLKAVLLIIIVEKEYYRALNNMYNIIECRCLD